MRRTDQEFRNEVLRRSYDYKARRKRRRDRALNATLVCTLVLIGSIITLPFLGGMGGSSEAAAEVEWNMGSTQAPGAPAEEFFDKSTSVSGSSAQSGEGAEPADICPCVMVDGVLYFDTGRCNDDAARCGMMDGEITSSVEADQVPTEDDQSNFGTGYSYQYGAAEGTIEIFMSDHWMIFATEEVKQNMPFDD